MNPSDIGQCCLQILNLEIRQLFQNLLTRQTSGEPIQGIDHTYPHAPNARMPAALLRVDCDPLQGCAIELSSTAARPRMTPRV